MSVSQSHRTPGWRGRLILRQLVDTPNVVPRPHFATRVAAKTADAAATGDVVSVPQSHERDLTAVGNLRQPQ